MNERKELQQDAAVAMLRNFLEKMQDMDGTDILDMVREDLPELLRVTESGEALDWFEEIQEQLIKAERKRDQFMQAHAETQARAQRLERDCGSLLFVLRNIYSATPTSKQLTESSDVIFKNAAGAEKKMEILTRAQEAHKARARTLLAGGVKVNSGDLPEHPMKPFCARCNEFSGADCHSSIPCVAGENWSGHGEAPDVEDMRRKISDRKEFIIKRVDFVKDGGDPFHVEPGTDSFEIDLGPVEKGPVCEGETCENIDVCPAHLRFIEKKEKGDQ